MSQLTSTSESSGSNKIRIRKKRKKHRSVLYVDEYLELPSKPLEEIGLNDNLHGFRLDKSSVDEDFVAREYFNIPIRIRSNGKLLALFENFIGLHLVQRIQISTSYTPLVNFKKYLYQLLASGPDNTIKSCSVDEINNTFDCVFKILIAMKFANGDNEQYKACIVYKKNTTSVYLSLIDSDINELATSSIPCSFYKSYIVHSSSPSPSPSHVVQTSSVSHSVSELSSDTAIEDETTAKDTDDSVSVCGDDKQICNRSRDRDRDRERDRGGSRDRDRDRDRERNRDRDRSRECNRDRGRSRNHDRDRSRERMYGREYQRSRDCDLNRGSDYDLHRGYDYSRDRGWDRGSDRGYDRGYARDSDRRSIVVGFNSGSKSIRSGSPVSMMNSKRAGSICSTSTSVSDSSRVDFTTSINRTSTGVSSVGSVDVILSFKTDHEQEEWMQQIYSSNRIYIHGTICLLYLNKKCNDLLCNRFHLVNYRNAIDNMGLQQSGRCLEFNNIHDSYQKLLPCRNEMMNGTCKHKTDCRYVHDIFTVNRSLFISESICT
jgi:hypothetical protein